VADAPCLVDGCTRRARAKDAGLCPGHAYRKRRGLPVEVELRPWGAPRVTLRRAALAYNQADDDDEWRRAEWRLLKAGQRMRGRR